MLNFVLKLFGIHSISEENRKQIDRQGVLFQDENLSGTIHFEKYKAQGKYFYHKKVRFRGALFLTQSQLYGFAFSKTILNVPLNHPRFAVLNITLPSPDSISFSFNTSDFNPDTSGTVTCTFKTDLAQQIYDRLQAPAFH